jgi:uncharacterized membrane protein
VIVGSAVFDHGTVTPLTIPMLPSFRATGANSINNKNQYVGATVPQGTRVIATFWDHGTPSFMAGIPDSRISVARSINDSGQIVGTSGSHAVLWEKRVGTQPYSPVN